MRTGTTGVRVWAPAVRKVEVVLEREGHVVPLKAEKGGYFSGFVEAATGSRYGFRLDGFDRIYPDPASRYQPDGPHGTSEIVDPRAFEWTDEDWRGAKLEGQVIYEMHAGTFTREGTWAAASRELEELAALGITAIELMPIAEFDGRFGWGYDGVDLFAPSHLYGTPDDLRAFVDRAHACGVGVILDVVYNHFGPSGNYLSSFAPQFFSDRYDNEWGDALNFDGPDSGPVREFMIANAGYWIDEFHLDGLRLDATQQIFDRSDEHLLAAVGRRVRESAGQRSVILIAENEPQEARLVRPLRKGGYGLDAVWNDDFHHSAMVALTGRAEAYYRDTKGNPQELLSAIKYGYLFQGQHYDWQRQPRGTPALDIEPSQFVIFLQNHDQVANSAHGLRGHELASRAKWRAITALLLLAPGTPMLFQGQEFAASSPFLYFADLEEGLSEAVRKGRAEFLAQFPSIVDYEQRAELDAPGAWSTFERCKLDFGERETHRAAYALHRDLLRLRRETTAFSRQAVRGVDGSVLGAHLMALRFFAEEPSEDRVLIVNLGGDIERRSFAEPLLAPPSNQDWMLIWSTEDPAYGGGGTPDLWVEGRWRIPAESSQVLAPGPKRFQRKPLPRRTA